jgi:hypothetical protein
MILDSSDVGSGNAFPFFYRKAAETQSFAKVNAKGMYFLAVHGTLAVKKNRIKKY